MRPWRMIHVDGRGLLRSLLLVSLAGAALTLLLTLVLYGTLPQWHVTIDDETLEGAPAVVALFGLALALLVVATVVPLALLAALAGVVLAFTLLLGVVAAALLLATSPVLLVGALLWLLLRRRRAPLRTIDA